MSVVILLESEIEVIFDVGNLRKKVLYTLSIFELKKFSCAVSRKVIFSLVKDFFNSIGSPSRSVIKLLGSEIEIIFDEGDLRKKYLTRCQISSSKNFLVLFHEK